MARAETFHPRKLMAGTLWTPKIGGWYMFLLFLLGVFSGFKLAFAGAGLAEHRQKTAVSAFSGSKTARTCPTSAAGAMLEG